MNLFGDFSPLCGMGKETAANLETMGIDILEKLSDIEETWADMENSGEGSKAIRSVLARAVRASAKSTKRAIHQMHNGKNDSQKRQSQH